MSIDYGQLAAHVAGALGALKGYGHENTAAAKSLQYVMDELMKAYLEAAREPVGEGWLPIDTAPKDGTHIMVAWNGQARFAKWSLIKKRWLIFLTQGYSSTNYYGYSTHWMPLPLPPTKASEDE